MEQQGGRVAREKEGGRDGGTRSDGGDGKRNERRGRKGGMEMQRVDKGRIEAREEQRKQGSPMKLKNLPLDKLGHGGSCHFPDMPVLHFTIHCKVTGGEEDSFEQRRDKGAVGIQE